MAPAINLDRLLTRIASLAEIGPIEGGGVCRLALSEEDRAGRDRVVGWMRSLGLAVTVDAIGNVVGLRGGREDGPPVMTGSHIDSVRTGGRYDGTYGVLAGLEVIETLNDAGIVTRRPLAVAFFTNEEGARFAPDMMGSLVYVGGMTVAEARAVAGIDGVTVGAALDGIGYAGTAPAGTPAVHAFVELHIEQGPVLEAEGITIGAVTGVQGISWTELTIRGESNHAGTTPMRMRRDAGYCAGAVIHFVRALATEIGEPQVATVGSVAFTPNLVNVVPSVARLTVDLRHTEESVLAEAEARLHAFVAALAAEQGVGVSSRSLARFAPVGFDPAMVDRIERIARHLGNSVRRMPSGAGHDAQMLARLCPAGMIFVPSKGGISHNAREFTAAAELGAGADVLLHAMLELAA